MTTGPTPTDPAGGRAYRAPAGTGDVLRHELLDAAEALLIEKGDITAVSLRQVARNVGVSATSVYLHFSDKDDLLLAVCHRRFTEFTALIRETRAAHSTPTAQLRACGIAYVRFGQEHPEQYKVLFGSLPIELVMERLPPEEMVGLQALEEMASIVRAGIEAGEFRVVDPFPTAVALWAMVHGLVGVIDHGLGHKPIDAEELITTSLDLMLEGLQTA